MVLRTIGGLVWTAVLLIAVWAIGIQVSGLDPFFAKSPGAVWTLLTDGPRAASDRELIFGGLGTTMLHAATGFAVGIASACVFAALFVLVPLTERALMPVAIALRSIPILATIPIVILVLGRGELATTATVALLSFFPTLVNVLAGLRSARAEVVELLSVYNCSSVAILRKARIPAAIPNLFASARIAVPASVLGAVVVEWLSTGEGLGNAILAGAFNARYGILWAAAAVLCTVTMLGYAGVSALERLALRRFAPEQLDS
jgi:ABC-type nitrate/sulfonate/bicarbonate transport system permease component